MKGLKIKICLVISIILILICAPTKIYAAEKQMNKLNVLFITSGDYNSENFNDQIRGIKEGMNNNVNIRIEHMDIPCSNDKEQEEKFYRLISYNIESYGGFDAIIAADDKALEFCLKYRESLFKSMPVAFLGVKDDRIIKSAIEHDLVAGVKEFETIEDNIKIIREIHKNIDRIIFIDNDEFNNDIIKKYNEFTYENISTKKLSLEEFENKLSKLTRRDAIIVIYPNKLRDQDLSYLEFNKLIVQNSPNTPIYNASSCFWGEGSIGGKVIDYFNQGEKLGKIVLGMINGDDPKMLNILDDSTNKYIFDYTALKKFSVKVRDLPKEAEIINDPIDILKEYKYIIIGIIIGGMALISIVITLMLYIKYEKNYEKKILKAMHKAEEANKLKTHFISNISHELKTPINVILSAIHLAEIKNIDGDTKNYGIIKENCYRLIRLLNNIIDVEKSEVNDLKLEIKNTNIVNLIEDLVLSIVPYAEHKNLNIIFDTNEEEVVMAVDVNKIERIILNLLSNAIKFSKDNGNIEVKLKFTEEILEISIEDDGIGIENTDIDRIFERFIRVDNTFCRKNEGSGIGLSIVKCFVELHEGRILVFSEINKGSKFVVEIPRKVIGEENNFNLEDKIRQNIKIELSDIYI